MKTRNGSGRYKTKQNQASWHTPVILALGRRGRSLRSSMSPIFSYIVTGKSGLYKLLPLRETKQNTVSSKANLNQSELTYKYLQNMRLIYKVIPTPFLSLAMPDLNLLAM